MLSVVNRLLSQPGSLRARLNRIILLALLLGAAAPAAAASRDLVVVDENLAEAGGDLGKYFGVFLRRIEKVAGWPKGSLRGQTVLQPREATAVIKKRRAGFAIVPVHQLLMARKELKLEVLARVAGLEGRQLNYIGLCRRPKPFTEVSELPVLKLASIEPLDPAWFYLVSDGAIGPQQPLDVKPVQSSREALRLLREKQVDVALVSPTVWKEVEKDAGDKGTLDVAFSSARMPVSAFVAIGKHVSAADKKKMTEAVGKVCKEDGADACGGMRIMFIEPGRQDVYDPVMSAYEAMTKGK